MTTKAKTNEKENGAAKPKPAHPILAMIADGSAPLDHRLEMLRMVLNDPNPEAQSVARGIVETLGQSAADQVHAQKVKELNDLLHAMKLGPQRGGTFLGLLPPNGTAVCIAHVVLDDGTTAYTVVPDAELAKSLRRGDAIILEGKGHAVLRRGPAESRRGEIATFERRLDATLLEVNVRGAERAVFLASQDLTDALDAGACAPGAQLVVNTRQSVAYAALPEPDNFAHWRYLAKEPVPDVRVERDIGAPPRCIAEVRELIRLEMTRPDLRRRYKLRRCVMKLLAGVSGSGKTLAILAIWRAIYEVMSEVTGVPVDQLPPRVFRLRLSTVLSMWLGESDRNLDRFFNEVEKMAATPVMLNGVEYFLPVIAILEEVDGLARARGGHGDAVYDRILTTALQRLDTTRQDLKDRLILYLGTTNEPEQVDRAFLRRIGGTVEKFGRLNRRGFAAVLSKHLGGLPLARHNGHPEAELVRDMVAEVSGWLFAPNGPDRGLVELAYAGSPTPDVRHRCDFLTGALVDRAVQQAAAAAVEAELAGATAPGVNADLLIAALDEQVRSVADQLTEFNARAYLDVPEGMRVAGVRRLPQPALSAREFQRP